MRKSKWIWRVLLWNVWRWNLPRQNLSPSTCICSKWMLDKYRQHPASGYSLAGSTRQSELPDYFSWTGALEEYLLKHRVKNTEVGKVLKQELFPYRYPHIHHMSEKFWYRHRRMKQLVKLLGQRTLSVQVRYWLRVQKSRRWNLKMDDENTGNG